MGGIISECPGDFVGIRKYRIGVGGKVRRPPLPLITYFASGIYAVVELIIFVPRGVFQRILGLIHR